MLKFGSSALDRPTYIASDSDLSNAMIRGDVKRGEARVLLQIKGRGAPYDVECVVDTGFTGELALPSMLISRLRLSWNGIGRSVLADGSVCRFDVFDAIIVWDGRNRAVTVDEAGPVPLVGMQLLNEHELRVQVRDGGKISIKRLRR